MILLPALALLWLYGDLGPYETYGYPPLWLYFAWTLWALLSRRVPMKPLMGTAFWIVVAFWIGLMVFRLHVDPQPAPGVPRLGPGIYMVFIILSIAAHLLFTTRTALKASIAIVSATVIINFSWLATKAGSDDLMALLSMRVIYETMLAIAVLMLYALAKIKDHHAETLLEAERLHGIAYLDTLTGIPNRRRLEEDLEHHLALAERHEHPLSVVLFDIDRFKHLNDTYGHQLGDEILKELGRHVRSTLRAGDLFGRWGGEEFMIIAPTTSHEQAMVLADRARQAIEEHTGPATIPITASFGIATWPGDATTLDDLLRRADQRLYQAKDAGRNRVAGDGECLRFRHN